MEATEISYPLRWFTLAEIPRNFKNFVRGELTADTRNAAREYLKIAPDEGIIWRRSCKGTSKLSSPMNETSAERALTKRVELLGRRAGVDGLPAHDARHYWATYEARYNTPVNRLMDAGGWSSPAMPLRYIQAAHIANDGTARVKPAASAGTRHLIHR